MSFAADSDGHYAVDCCHCDVVVRVVVRVVVLEAVLYDSAAAPDEIVAVVDDAIVAAANRELRCRIV